ncbi:MAG TPA: OmpA family protein, partial [Prolixibacteraceae bacterium]|nr:OmpA family protein [Prolixibacteraceae bacterium]
VLILKTDKKGYYETPADNGVLYVAKAMSKGYFDDCLNFRVPDRKATEKPVALRDLLLDKYALNQVFVVQNIYYDLDKWAIRDDAKPSLDHLARLLKQYPISVELGSHTDSRASADYNIELSQKRAESVVRYLILSGINPARLTARGYGETKLVNKCADGVPCTEAEHQANRRTEFRITSIDGDEKGKKSFDPGVFKAGDKVPVQILDPEFFSGCLEAQALNEQKQASPEPEETLAGKDSNSSVWYSVQLAASVKQVKPEPQNFKGLAHVQERKIGKYFKYFEGHFSGFDAAAQECETLKVKFPGAFVVAIDGEKVERAVERKK